MRLHIMRIKRQEADVLVCLSCIKIEIVSHQNTCLVCAFIMKTQRGFWWLHLQYLCQAGIFSIFFPPLLLTREFGERCFLVITFLEQSVFALRKKCCEYNKSGFLLGLWQFRQEGQKVELRRAWNSRWWISCLANLEQSQRDLVWCRGPCGHTIQDKSSGLISVHMTPSPCALFPSFSQPLLSSLTLKRSCPKYEPPESNAYLYLPKQFLSVCWNPAFITTSGHTSWPRVGPGRLFSTYSGLLLLWSSAGWVQLLEGSAFCQSDHEIGQRWASHTGNLIPIFPLLYHPRAPFNIAATSLNNHQCLLIGRP